MATNRRAIKKAQPVFSVHTHVGDEQRSHRHTAPLGAAGIAPQAQVHDALSSLEVGVTDLEQLAANLEQRLAFVVQPALPKGDDGEGSCHSVPLVARISGVTERIAKMRSDIADLTSRLEV